jgi:NitT/TauT family transport system ATP-binding protein
MDRTATEALTPAEGPTAPDASGAGVVIEAATRRFGALDALGPVDLRAEPGETVAIAGPSGCGKSTLLQLVAGLDRTSGGGISIGASAGAADRVGLCGYMPQRDLLLPWLAALDNAALPLRIAGASRRAAREAARPIFGRLGLEGFEAARPHELSGGMRKRVAFARTLLTDRPVLLLDEPFSALDAITRADLQEWLGQVLEGEPRTTLLVTHDVEEALYLGDRVAILSGRPGRVRHEERSPRPRAVPLRETVTAPDFVAARERALEALGSERS